MVMREAERIQGWIDQLITGWTEKIEFGVLIDGATEKRVRRITHPAMLYQLEQASKERPVSSEGGRTAKNKPGSRPPTSLEPLNLLDEIKTGARQYYDVIQRATGFAPEHDASGTTELLKNIGVGLSGSEHFNPELIDEVHHSTRTWVHRGRLLLGHDKKQTSLRDMVCGDCGGTLIVASDASTDVRCAGSLIAPPCGRRYTKYDWVDLAIQKQAKILGDIDKRRA